MIREAELYQALQTSESDVPHARDTATFLKARLACAESARTSMESSTYWFTGKVITGHVDHIEKKPVVHYMPGSKIFSIARETGKQSSSESMSGYLTQGRSSKQSKRSGTRPKSTSI